ncbi:MAG: hypothetical protein VB138_09405 [Burkholderia sp.]
MKTAITVVLICAALSGCATKQFATVGDVTGYERTAMTCHDIDLEAAKTQGVIDKIDAQSKFNGLDVLAFLGDFGIGNAMAKSSALGSAHARMIELDNLRTDKGCALTTIGAK